MRITPERRAQAESFFERHGGRAILLGRFVGLLRALTPFIAGTSGIALRRVLPYIVVGTLAWAAAFTLLGYAFADSFERAGDTAGHIVLGLVAVIALAIAVKLVHARRAGAAVAGT
ncbi:MAG TPA: VTT domain-containing protein [Solirubrobacteraceae bacterium]|nr:VTT domain-containing protein [Solirubrobacteraceae bacterium]